VTLRVSVVLASPGRQEVVELELAEGATLADAVAAAKLPERFPGVELEDYSTGIWSRPRPATTLLRDGDRVELYRPLRADAKAQRRARARLTPSSTRSRSGR
jgi:putative ubiquitin-RnfH superfamily antitoxin RatB of RatAB toxin-antitoxin module